MEGFIDMDEEQREGALHNIHFIFYNVGAHFPPFSLFPCFLTFPLHYALRTIYYLPQAICTTGVTTTAPLRRRGRERRRR
jgi:hypothetical protein